MAEMVLNVKEMAHTAKASLLAGSDVPLAKLLTAAHDVIAKTNHTSHRGAKV
jgi:hypothetical protein